MCACRSTPAPVRMAAVCLLVALCAGSASGEWAELSWDECGPGCVPYVAAGRPGQMLAVGFEAPEWARFLIGARFYICNDQVDDPVDPELPTTLPFLVRVWRASGGLLDPPGTPAVSGISTSDCSSYPQSYPEDEWLDVVFEEPIFLDPAPGSGRVFFVGMEWEQRLNPFIGDSPFEELAYTSWRWNWSTWDRVHGDVMIHAIVADRDGDGAEIISWGGVKARYRD